MSMSFVKCAVGLAAVLALVACGGGGGSAGTSSGGTTTPISADPLLSGSLRDAAGAATNSIGASGYTVLNVTLKDPSGNPIPNQVVDVSGDVGKVIFPEGSAGLTNALGVATVKLARASLVATGAGSLAVTFSYKVGSITRYPNGTAPPTADKVISTYVGYQLSAANITLTNMDAGAPTLAAYGTRQVSVQANINGVPVSATPVQVNFTTTCGQVSPATASTNSSGVVLVSYTATDAAGATSSSLGCSGKTVEISASTIGAAVVSKSLNIQAAPATNLSFVSVSPSMIFLANSGGATQAIAEFKLVNARGEALLGQDVTLTLKTQVVGTVKASFGTVGNIAAVTVTTDSNGKVSVPVFSGTVPTSVIVNAALTSNPLVQTDSAILTIASGRAAQDRASLSIKDLAIEGFNIDGVSTDVTMSLADRQGNPVPDGTAVNFVTEAGVMIPPVCYTGGVKDPVTGVYSAPGNSQCSVTIRSQAPRPIDGRVSILAYVAGEEDFVDRNFNNVYDAGDTFTDLGNAFRDDNENLTFDAGEFSVPRSGAVSAGNGCPGLLGRSGTCDGAWGAADVRKQTNVIFATGAASIVGTLTSSALTVVISDLNGNSVPTGSTVEASGAETTVGGPLLLCLIVSDAKVVIGNTTSPSTLGFVYSCDPGDILTVKVTTPLGTVSSRSFTALGVTTPVVPFSVLSGSTMTVAVDEERLTTVSGGTTPYSTSSSSIATATVTLVGTRLTIKGVATGTATITVRDATGASFPIVVTVGP
jgi:hypothetical protein